MFFREKEQGQFSENFRMGYIGLSFTPKGKNGNAETAQSNNGNVEFRCVNVGIPIPLSKGCQKIRRGLPMFREWSK